MKAMSYNSYVHENLLVPRCLQLLQEPGAVLLQQCEWTWITEVYVPEVLTYWMSVCSERAGEDSLSLPGGNPVSCHLQNTDIIWDRKIRFFFLRMQIWKIFSNYRCTS